MATVERTIVVVPTGVGRKDYSRNVEFATQQYIRSHELQVLWSLNLTNLPSLPYGSVWASVYGVLQDDGSIGVEASSYHYHVFNIRISTDRNSLLFGGLYRWDSYAHLIAGLSPNEVLREEFRYHAINMDFARGVRTREGSTYALGFNELVGPTFNVRLVTTGLLETVPE